MKYLATKPAIVQAARSEGKVRTEKIGEDCHSADILTKPLQGKEFEFKRGRLLGLRVAPPREAELRRGRGGECRWGRSQGRPSSQRTSRPSPREMEPGSRAAGRTRARTGAA